MLGLLIATLAFSVLAEQQAVPDAQHDQNARDLVALGCNTYVDNIERLAFFTCEFHYVIDSPGVERRRVNGLWIKDGSLTKFEMGCDEKYLEKRLKEERLSRKNSPQPKGKGFVTVDCPLPYALLLDGDKSADHGIVISGLAIGLTPREFAYLLDIPLHMRVMGMTGTQNPGQLLHDCLSGQRVARIVERREHGGRKLLRYVIHDKDEKTKDGLSPDYFELQLDLDRGCLPVRMSRQIGDVSGSAKVFFELTTDEFYELPEGQWFPKHSIVMRSADAVDKGKHRIKEEWFVTRLDVARRPAVADFSLDIPDGTQIHAPPLIGAAFRTRGRRTINVADIDRLYQNCLDAKAAAEQRRLSRKSQSSLRSQALPAIIWFNVVVILVLGTFYISKRFRRPSRIQ